MPTLDKVKNALHLNKTHSTTNSQTTTRHTTTSDASEGVDTSHGSNAANPRIDSDSTCRF